MSEKLSPLASMVIQIQRVLLAEGIHSPGDQDLTPHVAKALGLPVTAIQVRTLTRQEVSTTKLTDDCANLPSWSIMVSIHEATGTGNLALYLGDPTGPLHNIYTR